MIDALQPCQDGVTFLNDIVDIHAPAGWTACKPLPHSRFMRKDMTAEPDRPLLG